MLTIKLTQNFKKDLDRPNRRGYDLTLLSNAIQLSAKDQTLPAKYKDHALQDMYEDCRVCFITPDWLLIYKIIKNELVLVLSRTGIQRDTLNL